MDYTQVDYENDIKTLLAAKDILRSLHAKGLLKYYVLKDGIASIIVAEIATLISLEKIKKEIQEKLKAREEIED